MMENTVQQRDSPGRDFANGKMLWNKKAMDLVMQNALYVILVIIFVAGMFFFIQGQQNGASIWEKYYAKEISRVINLAQPGDSITLDIQKATEIAQENELQTFSEIFQFDNINNEICVKLSLGRKSCYYYFNNVDIVNTQIELAVPENILKFKVIEKQKEQNE